MKHQWQSFGGWVHPDSCDCPDGCPEGEELDGMFRCLACRVEAQFNSFDEPDESAAGECSP